MFSIQIQFFLCFHVYGSILPFFAVYLKSKGLDEAEIGYLFGVGGLAIIVTPVLTTLLADTHFSSKKLLCTAYGTSALALLGFLYSDQSYEILPLALTMGLMFILQLALVCMPPLQDGLQFQYEERLHRDKKEPVPYHQVRVWGTIGFMLPSIFLYYPLQYSETLTPILWIAIGSSLVGVFNSLKLPDFRSEGQVESKDVSLTSSMEPASETPALSQAHHPGKSMPTIEAIKVIMKPPILIFCLGMLLVQMVSGTYYTFYPVYLNEVVELDEKWLGLVAISGVTVEIIYMLAFGWMRNNLGGYKGILLIGVFCMCLRMYLLGVFDTPLIGIGIQLMHGLTVIASHMIAPLYLNDAAEARFRNSIQGIYVMVVLGLGRLLGNVLAGQIARPGAGDTPYIQRTFIVMAGLALIAFVSFLWMKPSKQFDNRSGVKYL